MGKSFQAKLDFRSGQTFQPQSPELATFLDLPEHGFRLNRAVASVFQPLPAGQELTCPRLVIIKGMVDLYLSVPF